MKSRFSLLLHALFLAPAGLVAQSVTPTCVATAVPALVRAEGITERVGDIVLTCTGPSSQEVAGNLSVFLSTTVTNRLLSDTGALDLGPTAWQGTLASATQVAFNNVRIPFSAAGRAEIRLTGIRANATAALNSTSTFPQPIVAQISFTPATGLAATNATLQVAVPERGLLSTSAPTVVPCQTGSPLPEVFTFAELINAGTTYASTRVTEGYSAAFEPQVQGTSRGTRVMLRFSGVPANARLFVPNGIAGSSALVPTSGGDFGGAVSGGMYMSGSGTLYLSRVAGTNPSGEGGAPVPVEQTVSGVSEVLLTGGSGVAVFEVRDANPNLQESAQIPVFIGVPRSISTPNATVGIQVTFAPVSTVFTAASAESVPRFVSVNAPNDCNVFRDCNVYVPKLTGFPANLNFTLIQGTSAQYRTLSVSNGGGGRLPPWTARVEYSKGARWVVLDRDSGTEPGSVHAVVTALPNMEPGIYEAAVVIDAAAAGVIRYPIRLEVLPRPAQPPPVTETRPAITDIVHGATFEPVPVALGSFATIRGLRLRGRTVSVTFDGHQAHILYSGDTQINLRVPADLPGNTAQVVVTVDGSASEPKTVQVRPAWPGIFNPGILNQDGTVNSPTSPAAAGSYVQIYATGLLSPASSGVVDAKLHDVVMTAPPYAGPAPGIEGLQQVNLQIPEYFPTMTTEVLLCTTSSGQRQCSSPVKIYVRSMQ